MEYERRFFSLLLLQLINKDVDERNQTLFTRPLSKRRRFSKVTGSDQLSARLAFLFRISVAFRTFYQIISSCNSDISHLSSTLHQFISTRRVHSILLPPLIRKHHGSHAAPIESPVPPLNRIVLEPPATTAHVLEPFRSVRKWLQNPHTARIRHHGPAHATPRIARHPFHHLPKHLFFKFIFARATTFRRRRPPLRPNRVLRRLRAHNG